MKNFTTINYCISVLIFSYFYTIYILYIVNIIFMNITIHDSFMLDTNNETKIIHF